MDETKIFTLNCKHNIGRITSNSQRVEQPRCSECNRTIYTEIKYASIEFEFDEYNEEDMFFSHGCLIASEGLFKVLDLNKIKGFAPIKISYKKSKYFEGELEKDLTFIYLAIFPPVVKNEPISYSFAEKCNTCGNMKIDFDNYNMDLMLRDTAENQQPLNVFKNSWNENDIFNFLDHSEIGITQKFLDVIKDFNCPDNVIIPAEWI